MDVPGFVFKAGPVTRAPPIRLQVFSGGSSLGATRRREAAFRLLIVSGSPEAFAGLAGLVLEMLKMLGVSGVRTDDHDLGVAF